MIDYLHSKLENLKEDGALRELSVLKGGHDFISNDYLGLVKDDKIAKYKRPKHAEESKSGSTGSRLLSGNSEYYESVEYKLAKICGAEASLIYSSGYQANVGLMQCIAERGDTLIMDQLCHASLIDGSRVSHAQVWKFAHNDMSELEALLTKAKGKKIVVTESLFSMDGDEAPLKDLFNLLEKYDAYLIIDEAHAFGVYGEKGRGLSFEYRNNPQLLARIVTFGKAGGVHGAAILGSDVLRSYLINKSRAFIFSTAPSRSFFQEIETMISVLEESEAEREKLRTVIKYFNQKKVELSEFSFIESDTQIQGVLVSGNERVMGLSNSLVDSGICVKAVRYPTVSKGQERLRICLHSFNTEGEIDELFRAYENM